MSIMTRTKQDGLVVGQNEDAFKVRQAHETAPVISIIIPTYNERPNIRPMVESLRIVLATLQWELIFVDDDSGDFTFEEVNHLAQEEPRVRCLRRIGRRGLSSAIVEGALAANAPVIVVMDADFQHDEAKIPAMYDMIMAESADVVVGSRYVGDGSIGEWNPIRAQMSRIAKYLSRRIVDNLTTDPVSGFFMIRRNVFISSIYDLSQQGYKILIDILTSVPRPVKVLDMPYVFRNRREGESKISVMVLAEFAFLLIDKITNGWIPPRFVLFSMVGGLGLIVHIAILKSLQNLEFEFIPAQMIATYSAMLFNFILNNEFTYRDRRLRGISFVMGLVSFGIICSIGALANVGVASLSMQSTHSWTISGIAGALFGAVFNFGAASNIVWGNRRRGPNVK